MKLDIACGQNKQPGHKGIDMAGDADIIHDLFTYPWPVKASSVSEAFCSHFVEHIPHWRPGWEKDGWWLFFEEVQRVLRKGATIRIVHPYVMSTRAFWDPTHVRFIHEVTWYYLDAQWRAAQGLGHYPTTADFEIVTINGSGIPEEIMSRNEEYQAHVRAHDWNVVADLEVILKCR